MASMVAIVDDDLFVGESLSDLIQSMGYRTAVFLSAEHFLQSGSLRETACVITDLQMPGLSGLELQNRLAAEGRLMPVIIITAFPDENCRRRAMRAGAIGFLTKPCNEEALINCLQIALPQRTAA
jgi:FixJ family two-component response regulator